MEPDKNYFLVGVFVVLFTFGILGFTLWLVGDKNNGKYDIYQTFISESVNGLSVGSPVKYRGVEVGKVTIIEIAKRNLSKIRVVMQILNTTPITTETRAILQLQGITGVAYMELKGGGEGEKIAARNGERIPVIPSAPSEFRQIVDTVPAMLQKFTELANNLNGFASNENKERFTSILVNLQKFSTDVGGENGSGQNLIEELRQSAKALGDAAKSISDIANNSREDTQRILKTTAETMDKIGKLTDSTGQLTQKSYSDLHDLLLEIKKTARDLQSLSRSLKENPSQVVIPVQSDGVKVP